MLSDLLIGPSPTCQHGNRKLHRRQLPRNLSPVFRIMKRHPAPAERNHTLRDSLIRLRIPVPDTGLDQPPQKPMMLNKRLQKPIYRGRGSGNCKRRNTAHTSGQIPPRDLTTLLRLPRKIKKLSPRNIPQIHIHKPLNNLPSPPRLKRRIQKRQNHIITHTTHSPPKPRQPPKDHPQNQTNKPPKPSHKPHQHTSEAHHTPLINIHPKLISQTTSAYIRSSSLKSHQHTSEALLSSPTKQSPKLRISINQSISQPQPIRPTIFFHNYNPKYSKNKFKYYTKTPHPIQNSLYPQSPHDKPQKNSPHPHPAQRRCHTPLVDCLSVRSSLPPFIPQKKSPQAQTPGNSPKTKQHHLPLRSFLSSLSNRSARAFSLNVFTLSSLRPCSIP